VKWRKIPSTCLNPVAGETLIVGGVATHPLDDIGKTRRHLHNLYNSRDIATVGLRAAPERASAVMAQHVEDSIGKKFLLVLLKLASLPGIVYRGLALIIGVLLLSESVAAKPLSLGVTIAQQPAASSQDAAAAQRIFQEGMQL